MVKNLSAMQETLVRSLGGDYLLEKRMAMYSSILAWKIPWKEEPGGLQSRQWQRVGHDWVTNTYSDTITPLDESSTHLCKNGSFKTHFLLFFFCLFVFCLFFLLVYDVDIYLHFEFSSGTHLPLKHLFIICPINKCNLLYLTDLCF